MTALTRRGLLGLGFGLAGAAAGLAQAASGTLLGPAAYGDPAVLAALGKGKTTFLHRLLARDDLALAAIGPLPAADPSQRPSLVAAAHPWMQGELWPEGAIEPVLADAVAPAAGALAPSYPATRSLQTGFEGRFLLGLATRFDVAAVVIHAARVSAEAVAAGDLGLFEEPPLKGRLGLLADARTALPMLMAWAGLNPFRPMLAAEKERWSAFLAGTGKRIGLVGGDPAFLLKALGEGRIDAALPLGLRHVAPLRLADPATPLRLAFPGRGPLVGRSALGWIEILARASQAAPDPAVLDALEQAQGPDFTLALARAGGGLAPVVNLANAAAQARLSAAELTALDWARLPELFDRTYPLGLIPERAQRQAELEDALAGVPVL